MKEKNRVSTASFMKPRSDSDYITPAIAEKQSHPSHSNDEGSLASAQISAGFPTPGDNGFEPLDLNTYFVQKPHATFFLQVRGDSMEGAGIFEGDLLVVDRSRNAHSRDIVVASLDEEMTVKRLVKEGISLFLVAENSKYPKILVNECCDIWGVVTGVLRKF